MKKLIKNRKKGVAIEISIIALVVVFAISTLLVSISIMANAIGKNALSDQQEKTQLAQVAMSYIKTSALDTDYTIETDNNIKILTKQNGNIKLKFSFTETKTITFWAYTTN